MTGTLKGATTLEYALETIGHELRHLSKFNLEAAHSNSIQETDAEDFEIEVRKHFDNKK